MEEFHTQIFQNDFDLPPALIEEWARALSPNYYTIEVENKGQRRCGKTEFHLNKYNVIELTFPSNLYPIVISNDLWEKGNNRKTKQVDIPIGAYTLHGSVINAKNRALRCTKKSCNKGNDGKILKVHTAQQVICTNSSDEEFRKIECEMKFTCAPFHMGLETFEYQFTLVNQEGGIVASSETRAVKVKVNRSNQRFDWPLAVFSLYIFVLWNATARGWGLSRFGAFLVR
jgi:hypothetical protein